MPAFDTQGLLQLLVALLQSPFLPPPVQAASVVALGTALVWFKLSPSTRRLVVVIGCLVGFMFLARGTGIPPVVHIAA